MDLKLLTSLCYFSCALITAGVFYFVFFDEIVSIYRPENIRKNAASEESKDEKK